MLTALPLRPYQSDGLDALGVGKRELIALPTGGGKTVMFAHLAARHIAANPNERVLVLVHTDELVAQAHQKITDVAPTLRVGIVKAARDDVDAPVIVASVQTLRNARRRERITDVGLLIVDEAHHAPATTYRAIMDHYGCRAVGFTATPERGDGQSLYPVWERVAFSREISWMVRKGWLIPPRGKAVEVPDLDLRSVKVARKDYSEGQLGAALAESLAPQKVAQAYLEHAWTTAGMCTECIEAIDALEADGQGRACPSYCPNDGCSVALGRPYRRGLLFAPTVASAGVFADALNDEGIKAEVVHGGMPLDERRAVLARHRAGVTQVVCNCMILTEGYDDPAVDCIVIARPTRSRPLYIQMAGRGLRVDPARPLEEQDCLLLDVVGAASRVDLRTVADLSERDLTEEQAHSGRTLVDLEDEFDAGLGIEPDAPVYYRGEVTVRDFDPLARKSSKVWIRTKAGSFFVPAGKHGYVFIAEYPSPGLWSVCWAGTYGSTRMTPDADGVPRLDPGGRSVGMTAHRGLPLDQAMVWAEDLAVDMGADTMILANKRAAWRRGQPSEKTVRLAESLGIKVEGKKAGQVSDEIGVVLGSNRIDPLVKGMVR